MPDVCPASQAGRCTDCQGTIDVGDEVVYIAGAMVHAECVVAHFLDDDS